MKEYIEKVDVAEFAKRKIEMIEREVVKEI